MKSLNVPGAGFAPSAPFFILCLRSMLPVVLSITTPCGITSCPAGGSSATPSPSSSSGPSSNSHELVQFVCNPGVELYTGFAMPVVFFNV